MVMPPPPTPTPNLSVCTTTLGPSPPLPPRPVLRPPLPPLPLLGVLLDAHRPPSAISQVLLQLNRGAQMKTGQCALLCAPLPQPPFILYHNPPHTV